MSEFHKDRELEHMFELQGNNRSGCPDHTADIWDKRMKNWKQNFWTANLKDNGSGKSMARVRETAAYLKQAGVLGPDTDVIDIGCGPGRFVSEFARTAAWWWAWTFPHGPLNMPVCLQRRAGK